MVVYSSFFILPASIVVVVVVVVVPVIVIGVPVIVVGVPVIVDGVVVGVGVPVVFLVVVGPGVLSFLSVLSYPLICINLNALYNLWWKIRSKEKNEKKNLSANNVSPQSPSIG